MVDQLWLGCSRIDLNPSVFVEFSDMLLGIELGADLLDEIDLAFQKVDVPLLHRASGSQTGLPIT